MENAYPPSVAKVVHALDGYQVRSKVVVLAESTRTAVEAAAAIGCQVAEIAKSIVFSGKATAKAVLVVASGTNRIDENLVAARVGEPIVKADADYVREKTGYVIGGVPPTGHLNAVQVLVDEDLLQFKSIWAAAGSPYAVVNLTPEELLRVSGGIVAKVKK